MNRDDGKPTVMDLLAVSDCGYHLETSVLDGCEYGVPQQMVKSENEHEEKTKKFGRFGRRVQAWTLSLFGISIFDVSGSSPYSILVSLLLV
jgi:hypothetical protein